MIEQRNREMTSLLREINQTRGTGPMTAPASIAITALTIVAGFAGAMAGIFFADALAVPTNLAGLQRRDRSVDALYDHFIPGLAGASLIVTVLLATRAIAVRLGGHVLPRARRFGRKCTLITGASTLFAFSCVYRAVNIADEGAATCRGRPSVFNAPVAGRMIATFGEVALVVQVTIYIQETAIRLKSTQGLWAAATRRWTSIPFGTIGPVLFAELMSWTGVLSGNSTFFCAEYVLWMIVAVAWAWDGAELFHKSAAGADQVVHAGLTMAAIVLFFFNAFLEIPHFLKYQREASEIPAGIWECSQRRDSPIWLKRLPFFFCYFIGCSWCSVALSYRFLCRGVSPREKYKP